MQNKFGGQSIEKRNKRQAAVRSNHLALQQAIYPIFRQKRGMLAVISIITIATVLWGMLMPSKYRSTMKILVKNERADTIVSAEANASIDRSIVREETINSEIELLKSNDLLRKIVEQCRLDRLESVGPFRRGTEAEQQQVQVDLALKRLTDGLEITPVKKADIIEVTYQHRDPEIPAMVLKKLAEYYLEKHLQAHHSAGTAEFFMQQRNTYEHRMKELKEELAKLRESASLVDLEEQKKLNLAKLSELEASQLRAEVEYEDQMSRAARVREALRNTRQRIQTEVRVLSNQYSIERLNTMIVELRNKRTQLLTRFQPEDRLVKEVQEQLRETENALSQVKAQKETEESSSINPMRPPLEGELVRLEAAAAGLEVQKSKLKTQLSGYRVRLDQLEAVSAQHRNLERQIREAEESFEVYSKKAEEARIADALDKQKITNVAIAESPVKPLLPFSPNRSLILSIGLLLSLFTGLLWAFAADFVVDTVHTPAELETLTSLPVFATVPYLLAKEKKEGKVRIVSEQPDLFRNPLGMRRT